MIAQGAATAPPSQTDSSFVTNFYARLFAGKNNSIYPYGVDPVFLQTSSLYNPVIFNNMPLFYNTSDDQQISVNGIPYGFHHLDMPGYDDGFPVLFENSLSQTRSAQLMQYLLDGSYLDASSDTMTAELLTYNPVLHILGYAQAMFQWRDDGSITGTVTLSGLPALDYLLPTDSAYATFQKVFVHELAPLWTLTLFFLGYAIIKMCRAIEELSRGYVPEEKSSLRRGLRLLAYHAAIEKYDVLMAFIIFIGAVYYTLYMAKYASSFVAQANYKVYDGASVSSAHWLLTARENPNGTNVDPIALSNLNVSTPSTPADPGRWILPKGSNDMETYVSVMASTHVMLEYWTVYGIIQAVVILMLVIRLLLALTFQSRVAVITKTLAIAFPELVHLVVIIVTVTSMWAMLAHVVFGWREEYVSTYEDSLFWHFTAMIDLNKTNAIYLAATGINSIQVSMLENILIETCFIIYQLLDSRLLVNFVVTVLIAAFIQIRYSNKGKTSTAVKDLGEVVFPNLARWVREQVLLMGRKSGAHPVVMTGRERFGAVAHFSRTSRVFPSSQSALKENEGAPLPGSTDIATSALPSKHSYTPSGSQGVAARLQQPSDRWLQQKLREDVLHGWHKQAPSERVHVVKIGDMYFEVEALHGALIPFSERHMKSSDVKPSTHGPASKAGKINEMPQKEQKKGVPVSEAAVEIVESTETEKDLKAREAMEACLHNESLSASSSDSQTEKPVVEKLRGGGDIEAGVQGKHSVAPDDSESSERYRDSAPEAHLRPRASAASQQSFRHASFLFDKVSQGFRSFRQVLGDRNKGHEDASTEDVAKPIFSVENLEADVRALLVAQRLHVKLYTSIQIRPEGSRNKVERRPLEPHHVDSVDEHGMDFHKHGAKEKKSMPLKPVLGSLSTTYAQLKDKVIAMERWSEAIHRSHNVTRYQLAQATEQIATYIAKRTGLPAALPLSLLVPQPVSASAHTEHVFNGQGPSMTDVTEACPKAIGTDDTQGDIRGDSTKAIESPGPSACAAEPSTSELLEHAMASTAGPTRSNASLEGVPEDCKSYSVQMQSSRDAAEIMITIPAIEIDLFSKGALIKSSRERATILAVVQSEGRVEITP
ncbi:hypothetical protein CEUSTIGMA_g10291.t1 [Chlamydomonas eustigma]|uniref:Polycystin cation channel PKD1/PKD2 domain-containing protein n=1 Tax=Chlamydomonas eustigma TaxID=1157962 RepID=A0A250XIF7_9CHLO|nr:hypothetical protein CEUSTIGMA_g10291.t1 [Chlamydomonas eustigma]|eukprot:GAX82864.1 hypothetical protein CEUSTIGMA_g10291.t1 [Chlamydomonas eustigma]